MGKKDFKFGKDGKKPGRYPQEIKEQAVTMFARTLPEFKTRADCARHVADLLGIGSQETVQNWARQSEINGGQRDGASTEENDEIRRLRRENAELKRANGILKAASVFFAAELERPQSK
jgi:transposase